MTAPKTTPQTAPPAHARKEVGGFLIVGVAAVVLDFAIFNGLLWLGWRVWAANAIALFVSMTFAFLATTSGRSPTGR